MEFHTPHKRPLGEPLIFILGTSKAKFPWVTKKRKERNKRYSQFVLILQNIFFCNPQVAAWVLEKRPRSYRIWCESVSSGASQFENCILYEKQEPSIQIHTGNCMKSKIQSKSGPSRSTSCLKTADSFVTRKSCQITQRSEKVAKVPNSTSKVWRAKRERNCTKTLVLLAPTRIIRSRH